MAANPDYLPTMMDMAKMSQSTGTAMAEIVPVMQQNCEVLPKIRWEKSNGPFSNTSTYQVRVPRPTWTDANHAGIAPTVGTTMQAIDGLGEMQGYSMADPIVAEPYGVVAYRKRQDMMHLQGAGEELEETFFFGNSDVSGDFDGMAMRYAAGGTSPLATETVDHVIHGGGSGTDNQSMWLISLGSESDMFPGVVGIYRPGTVAGFQITATPQPVTVNGSTAGTYVQRYVTHYRWSCGIAVIDWRKNVRICNIDKSALTSDASSGAKLHELVAIAAERLPSGTQNTYLVLGRRAREYFRLQAINKLGNSTLDYDSLAGKRVLRVGEFEVLNCDALNADEALVPMS